MLPNKSQTNERDNELKSHSTKPLWGRLLVLAGFYIENNDGIQEIWNNSPMLIEVYFNRSELCIVSIFATTKLD